MWKNIVQPYRPQVTIRRMCIACWLPKATNTYSDYVIRIASYGNNGCREAPQYYVIRTLPVLLISQYDNTTGRQCIAVRQVTGHCTAKNSSTLRAKPAITQVTTLTLDINGLHGDLELGTSWVVFCHENAEQIEDAGHNTETGNEHMYIHVADNNRTYLGLHVKCSTSLLDLNQIWTFLTEVP